MGTVLSQPDDGDEDQGGVMLDAHTVLIKGEYEQDDYLLTQSNSRFAFFCTQIHWKKKIMEEYDEGEDDEDDDPEYDDPESGSSSEEQEEDEQKLINPKDSTFIEMSSIENDEVVWFRIDNPGLFDIYEALNSRFCLPEKDGFTKSREHELVLKMSHFIDRVNPEPKSTLATLKEDINKMRTELQLGKIQEQK